MFNLPHSKVLPQTSTLNLFKSEIGKKKQEIELLQAKLKHSNNLQNFAINFSVLTNFPKTFLHFRIASKQIIAY